MSPCYYYFYFVVIFALTLRSLANSYSLPTAEYNIVIDLYNSTNGANWQWKTPYVTYGYPWNVDSDPPENPCSPSQPWQGIVCTTSCGTQACNVKQLILPRCNLVGTIPNSLGGLSDLQQLSLFQNQLIGSLPPSLGNLTKLQYLELYQNQLIGSIPSALGNLSMLLYLQLYSNKLTGSIPPSMSNLHHLQALDLNNNRLTGCIPNSLGNLTNLHFLDLYNNRLSGSIPASLGNLTKLPYLYLFDNQLTGGIPPSLGNLTSLDTLDLSDNLLTGAIPASLGNIANVGYLFLYDNQLTGSIPDSLGNLSKLIFLYLFNNQLIGDIPSSLGYLSKLMALDVSNNQLNSSIPSSLGSLSKLQSLNLYRNQLTGSIPPALGNLNNILNLLLYSNYFSHEIPKLSASITTLDMHSNLLSGPIQTMSNLRNCTELILNKNAFSGSLTGLKFSSMVVLDLSYNAFIGKIPPDLLSSAITIAYLNNNALTGSIPDALFVDKPLLESVVLATNCFTGQLSSSMCDAIGLEQLILDGLHSAPSCVSRAIPFIAGSGLVTYDAVHGSIPACLLQMPALAVLHIGSNSLMGSIPAVAMLPPILFELVLSSNDLTGSIPAAIWHSQLTQLDVSLNRLQGTIPSDALPMVPSASSNGSISLQVNQLSGKIPAAWVNLPANSIEMLQGNMFECQPDRSDLPEHDPEYASYNCGSSSTDSTMIVFGAVFLFVVIVLLVVMLGVRSRVQLLEVWEQYQQIVANYSENSALKTGVDTLGWISIVFSGYVLTVVLLVNGTLSTSFSSYTHSYIWQVSGIYLAGSTPAACLLTYFWALLVLLTSCCSPPSSASTDNATQEAVQPSDDNNVSTKKRLWTNALLLTNVVVIMFVNGLYVSAYQQNYTSTTLLCIAFLISIFKMAWNNMFLASWNSKQLLGFDMQLSDVNLTRLCLFNNLVSPFLSELFVSPDCFLFVVSQVPSLTFTYSPINCVLQGSELVCSVNVLQQTSFNQLTPYFHYSYQCSFALISNYTYVFIFRYILSGLVMPLLSWILLRLCKDWKLLRALPKRISAERLSSVWMLLLTTQQSGDGSNLVAVERVLTQRGKLRQRQVVRWVTDFAMLLCFGSLFPPLALVIFVAISKDMLELKCGLYQLQQWIAASKQLVNTVDGDSGEASNKVDETSLPPQSDAEYEKETELSLTARLQQVQSQIEIELMEALPMVWMGLRYAVLISVCIWAFVLFDTLASQQGAQQSVWVVVVMVSCPVVVHVGRYWYDMAKSANSSAGASTEVSAGIQADSYSNQRKSSTTSLPRNSTVELIQVTVPNPLQNTSTTV